MAVGVQKKGNAGASLRNATYKTGFVGETDGVQKNGIAYGRSLDSTVLRLRIYSSVVDVFFRLLIYRNIEDYKRSIKGLGRLLGVCRRESWKQIKFLLEEILSTSM